LDFEEEIKDIRDGFFSGNAILRSRSARLAANHGMLFVNQLRSTLDDEFYEARGFSSLSLGMIGDKTSAVIIAKLLSDDEEEVRFQAAEALGMLLDNQTINSLVMALSDESRETRNQAILALKKFDQEYLGEEILNWLKKLHVNTIKQETEEEIEIVNVIRGIVEAVGFFTATWVDNVLEFGLQSGDLEMIRLSCLSIGNGLHDRFLEEVHLYTTHDDDDLRLSAIWSVVQFDFPNKQEFLLLHVFDSYEFIRELIIIELSHFPIENMEEIYQKYSLDSEYSVRIAMANSLGLNTNKSKLNYLKILLNDENSFVRQAVVKSLGNYDIIDTKSILEERKLVELDDLVKINLTNILQQNGDD